MIDKSIEAFNQAKEFIPGGVDSPVRAFKGVDSSPLFIKKAKGAYLSDLDNNEYLDFVQSWGPLIFGHCDYDIEQVVVKAVQKGLSYGAPCLNETKLAKAIVGLFDNIDKVRFVSSGTEATMSAIRLARGATGKDDIIKFEGCYHGHSDSLLVQGGSGMATFGSPSSPGVPNDFSKHTLVCEYNNLDSVKQAFEKSYDIACIIVEPLAGNMGLIPADLEFLEGLRKLCDENNALLIFDEVMSGFRASLKGASGLTNVQADILTFGKVIGGGMPVGAFGASAKLMDKLSPDGAIYQAGTLSGNPVAMSAGLKSLEKLIENPSIYEVLDKKAKRLVKGLKQAADENNIAFEVTSRGSMFGFFFSSKVPKNFSDVSKCDFERFSKFHKKMLEKGFYFACSQYETGFICVPITDGEIDKCIEAAKEIMKEL